MAVGGFTRYLPGATILFKSTNESWWMLQIPTCFLPVNEFHPLPGLIYRRHNAWS